MKENCACGFILADDRGWLLGHPTNAGDRWDFPKGWAEKDEDHLDAALRELEEETGVVLILNSSVDKLIDLGQHPYQDHRDLHLFYFKRPFLMDTKSMHCRSMVNNPKGPDFPEMDAFAVWPTSVVPSKVSARLSAWIEAHVPKELK